MGKDLIALKFLSAFPYPFLGIKNRESVLKDYGQSKEEPQWRRADDADPRQQDIKEAFEHEFLKKVKVRRLNVYCRFDPKIPKYLV